MPTPKQVRYHYGKISRLRWRLQCALNDAHNADVIKYDGKNYEQESPCKSLYECLDRIKATTAAQLAQAMREEIAQDE